MYRLKINGQIRGSNPDRSERQRPEGDANPPTHQLTHELVYLRTSNKKDSFVSFRYEFLRRLGLYSLTGMKKTFTSGNIPPKCND